MRNPLIRRDMTEMAGRPANVTDILNADRSQGLHSGYLRFGQRNIRYFYNFILKPSLLKPFHVKTLANMTVIRALLSWAGSET
jgi:hypothetical protein